MVSRRTRKESASLQTASSTVRRRKTRPTGCPVPPRQTPPYSPKDAQVEECIATNNLQRLKSLKPPLRRRRLALTRRSDLASRLKAASPPLLHPTDSRTRDGELPDKSARQTKRVLALLRSSEKTRAPTLTAHR